MHNICSVGKLFSTIFCSFIIAVIAKWFLSTMSARKSSFPVFPTVGVTSAGNRCHTWQVATSSVNVQWAEPYLANINWSSSSHGSIVCAVAYRRHTHPYRLSYHTVRQTCPC